MQYTVERTELDPQHVAVVSGRVAHDGIGAFIGRAFGQVMGVLGPAGVHPVGPPLARYDMDGAEFLVDVGFPTLAPIAETGSVHDLELPGGPAVTCLHIGAYADVAAAYQAMEAWMGEHDLVPASAPWETYLDGPEVAQPRTVVTWPCAPRT